MNDKRVVVITGGAGGIGIALADKYTAEGDAVVLVDVDETVGEERAEEYRKAGKEAIFCKVDITNEDECIALIEKVAKKYGRIDVLHNNAGILGKSAFLDMELSEFKRVMDVNLNAPVLLTKLAAKVMIDNNIKGVVINTSSLASVLPNHEPICYPISKAAINMLTQSAARELAPYGIRVVAVAPGWVRSIVKGGTVANPFEQPEITELHMRGRVIEKREVADVAYFVSTEAASGINGTTVFVDDGYTAFKLQTKFADK